MTEGPSPADHVSGRPAGSLRSPALGRNRDEEAARIRRRWVALGVVGWVVVAAITAVDTGFQQMLQGRPFAGSWSEVGKRLVILLPGVLLSPLVFAAFGRWVDPGTRLRARLRVYFGVGLLFWISWAVVFTAVVDSGLVFGGAEGRSFGGMLAHVLAVLAFNAGVLYAVMPLLYEAHGRMHEARGEELRAAELQAELSSAHTAALAAQLNPHFLFNTLHTVSGLMNRDAAAAKRVLTDLSGLLREMMDHDDRRPVRLADELLVVQRYTEIQKARFGDRLAVAYDVAPSCLPLRVPPLVLQPLLENAVHHGIACSEDGGEIRIEARRERDRLVLRVVNSGSRLDREGPVAERVGIGGVRARLALLYGDDASLELRRLVDGEFEARVDMPAPTLGPRGRRGPPRDGTTSGAAAGRGRS